MHGKHISQCFVQAASLVCFGLLQDALLSIDIACTYVLTISAARVKAVEMLGGPQCAGNAC